MKTKFIIITLLLGLVSINATAVPNNNIGKQITAFDLISIMQRSTVIAKAIGDINNHVNSNHSEILESLLQHDNNRETQLSKLTTIGISSLSFSVLAILLICYTNLSM
jgi:hypothetical protein